LIADALPAGSRRGVVAVTKLQETFGPLAFTPSALTSPRPESGIHRDVVLAERTAVICRPKALVHCQRQGNPVRRRHRRLPLRPNRHRQAPEPGQFQADRTQCPDPANRQTRFADDSFLLWT